MIGYYIRLQCITSSILIQNVSKTIFGCHNPNPDHAYYTSYPCHTPLPDLNPLLVILLTLPPTSASYYFPFYACARSQLVKLCDSG